MALQPRPIAAGTLHAGLDDLAVGGRPSDQGPITLGISREALGAEHTSNVVHHSGHVGAGMGVHADSDKYLVPWWLGHRLSLLVL